MTGFTLVTMNKSIGKLHEISKKYDSVFTATFFDSFSMMNNSTYEHRAKQKFVIVEVSS